jgi:SHS2 domain-containing protein
MANYALLEHTADLGIKVWGPSLNELFINAASAMYELIADTSTVISTESIEIKLEAQDKDELLRNWLSELLYYFNVKEMLLKEFSIESLNEKRISSLVKGEKIDLSRHELKREIKAVTFHGLMIKKETDRLQTDIIFDV